MKIFISWSGPKSGAVAKALREWLPMVVNAFDPWLSADDIDKGSRWNSEIAQELENSKAGIICLTASNLHSDWLLFEAGALSKKVAQSFVCPLLIGLKSSEVVGPLAQFQATTVERSDFLKLLRTLHGAEGDAKLPDGHLERAFDKWWPDLESKLKTLPSDDVVVKPTRSERELLEEILELVREQSREGIWEFPHLTPVSHDNLLGRRLSTQRMLDLVHNAVLAKGGKVGKVSIGVIEVAHHYSTFRIRRDGQEYMLMIPFDATAEEIPAIVESQTPAKP